MDTKALANLIRQKHPEVLNNPRNQALLSVLESGDEKKGMEVAQNLCDTYGVSKDDALAQAKNLFGI